jgi:hypothetical protein
MSSTPLFPRVAALAVVVLSFGALPGCAVVSVAGTAVSLAATAASVTVDAAVGTARVVGNIVLPSKSEGN